MNKTISVRLPVEDVRFFQNKYPYMFSQFVRKAVEKALASRDFLYGFKFIKRSVKK